MTEESQQAQEITQAARALAEALRENPAVQEYRAARDAAAQDANFHALEQALETLHQNLLARQQTGEAIPAQEVSRYYRLRDQVASHPLYTRRQTALRNARAVFEQAGNAINGVLTVDFTEYVE